MTTSTHANTPLIKVKNDVDYSIISPTDNINDGAFSLVIPVASEFSLPAGAIEDDEVELYVTLNKPARVLNWVGADEAAYRINLNRIDIDAVLKGNTIEEVDIFCIILSAMTGETLGIGEVIITEITT